MVNHLPTLDPKSLRQLRRLVQKIHRGAGKSVPLARLVELADVVRLDGGVTIDFDASRDLGHPMIVLRVPSRSDHSSCFELLSPRERDVAAGLSEGLSNREIAQRLFIAVATVKDHVHSILEKTGLPNRTAVALAYRGDLPQANNNNDRAR